jgi:Tfp pilus assembly protein PilF
LIERGEYHDAVQNILKAIDINPDYINAYSTLAIQLARIGKWSEARKVLKIAIEKDPGNETLLKNMRAIESESK